MGSSSSPLVANTAHIDKLEDDGKCDQCGWMEFLVRGHGEAKSATSSQESVQARPRLVQTTLIAVSATVGIILWEKQFL